MFQYPIYISPFIKKEKKRKKKERRRSFYVEGTNILEKFVKIIKFIRKYCVIDLYAQWLFSLLYCIIILYDQVKLLASCSQYIYMYIYRRGSSAYKAKKCNI